MIKDLKISDKVYFENNAINYSKNPKAYIKSYEYHKKWLPKNTKISDYIYKGDILGFKKQ